MNGNIGTPFFSAFVVDPELDWQMSRAEKYCLINLLQSIQPEVSIEIGTYKGGSLQVLNKYSQQVYSIDISTSPRAFLRERFPDVEFVVGEGHTEILKIFKELDRQGKKLGFVLVDGDHSKKGVQNDLHAILSYPHQHPLTILLHDSFNPQCRKGIKSIDYSKFPMVEFVELDYITGSFWHNDTHREMWGGLAMVKLNPLKKEPGVIIGESQGHLFKHTRLASVHLLKDPLRFLSPLKKSLYKRLGKTHKSAMYDDFGNEK